jgi:hypothetical protein
LSFTKEQFPSLHRFSLEQYYELGELGLLDRRTELLDGVINDMEPVSPRHANIGDILSRIFNEGARSRFRVRVQYPINLGQMSQPQPGLVLYRPGMWRGQHPGAADISPLLFRLGTPASHLILAKNLPSTGLTGSRSIGSST